AVTSTVGQPTDGSGDVRTADRWRLRDPADGSVLAQGPDLTSVLVKLADLPPWDLMPVRTVWTERFDPFVHADRTGRRGRMAGYFGLIRFDVGATEVRPDRWVRRHTVRLHLRSQVATDAELTPPDGLLLPGDGVPVPQLRKLAERAGTALRRTF